MIDDRRRVTDPDSKTTVTGPHNQAPRHGKTLAETMRTTTTELAAVTDTPWLDAQRLISAVSGLSAAQIVARDHQRLSADGRRKLKHWVERRKSGEPLAYILGTAGFWNLELAVNPAVLVPRPDTETLVEAALKRLPANEPLSVADLGTGSGAIAIALAHERPAWQVTATDIDPAAIAVARANAADNEADNIRFAVGDWFEAAEGEYFDAVIANPPYVASDDPHLTDPALAAEPRRALVANDNGLAALDAIMKTAPDRLRLHGTLLMEHGPGQGQEVRNRLQKAGYINVETIPDAADRNRATHALAP